MAVVGDAGAERAADAEPLAYRVVRGGLWVALSSYFNLGFGFLANLVLTRILAPEDFGVFALGMFFFSLANVRPRIGIGYAFAQRRETNGELLGTHLLVDVAAGLATLLIAGLLALLLPRLGYSRSIISVMLALAAVGISDSIMATAWIMQDKQLHFGRTALVSSLVFPLSYLPGLWLATHGGGYWSLVAQNATYALLLLVGMWFSAFRRIPRISRLGWRFDGRTAREFVRFGGLVGIASLATMLAGQLDNLLVGTFVGVAVLGFYDRAYRLAQWPSLLVNAVLTRAAFYTFARLQDDPVRLQKTVRLTLRLTTAVALPLALSIFVAAPDLVAMLYGERWLPSAGFLRVLVVLSVLRPLLDGAGSLLVASGQPGKMAVLSGAQAAVVLVIGAPLTLAHGAVGTCMAVGLGAIVGVVLAHRYLRQAVSLSLARTLAAPALAALLSLAASVLFSRLVGLEALPVVWRATTKAALAAVAFFAAMLAVERERFVTGGFYVWRLLRGGR